MMGVLRALLMIRAAKSAGQALSPTFWSTISTPEPGNNTRNRGHHVNHVHVPQDGNLELYSTGMI